MIVYKNGIRGGKKVENNDSLHPQHYENDEINVSMLKPLSCWLSLGELIV